MADSAPDTNENPSHDTSKNEVTVADAGPCSKKITIEVPADVVDETLSASLDTLVHEAVLPGFRKGRAPKRLIERKFGSSVRAEAKNQIVSEAFQSAVRDNELKVVGNPIAEELKDVELEDGKPFRFEVDVEIVPEFAMPSLEGFDVKKPVINVSDQMVDDEIEKMCVNEGSLEERDSAEAGDYITGHAIMKSKDGEDEHYNIDGAVIQKPPADKDGKGMILGIMVDDFDSQIGSPKPGDELVVSTKGPELHEIEAVRGGDLVVSFKVQRVDRIIPIKIDTLVERFGLGEQSQLRDAVRTRLTQTAMIEQHRVQHQQILRGLDKAVDIELPERMTASQSARTLDRRRLDLLYRGVDEQQIEEHMAELRAASEKIARRDLKLFFILEHAAEDLNVQVREDEINGRIAAMASQRGLRPERLRQQLIQQNRVSALFAQIREHKTLDQILSMATVTEVPADQFNALMRELDEADRAQEPAGAAG
ncbi:MAG: trigger factor [Planctomycetota bacterium]